MHRRKSEDLERFEVYPAPSGTAQTAEYDSRDDKILWRQGLFRANSLHSWNRLQKGILEGVKHDGYFAGLAELKSRPGGSLGCYDHDGSGNGHRFFRLVVIQRRMKTFDEAIRASENRVQEHLSVSESWLRDHFRVQAEAFEEFASAQNEFASQQAFRMGNLEADIIPVMPPDTVPAAQQDARSNMRASWGRIRDRLQAIALADTDRRARTRYARIDKRRYPDLVAALDYDKKLGADASFFREAADLWQKFRAGRAIPSTSEVQRMQEFADRVSPGS